MTERSHEHQPFRDHRAHEWARRVLAAEEPVLASCVVDYNGTVPPNHARMDAAIAEAAEVAEVAAAGPPDPGTLVAFPVAKRMALVLTPGRLLVFAMGFGGRPKRLLGEVPLSSVAAVHRHDSRYGEQLSVVMRSGAVVDLERRDGDPAEVFVARLTELAAGG
jgi:hypothetical protein